MYSNNTPDTKIVTKQHTTSTQSTNLHLYTGAMMQDLTVEQHSIWNRSVLNHLYRDCLIEFQDIGQKVHRTTIHHAFHHSCLVSESIILYNAHVSLPQP